MQYNNKREQTRELIYQAYFDLLKEKMSSQITVKELCTNACINRSTFYSYFSDIIELEDTLIDLLLSQASDRIADYMRNIETVDINSYASIVIDVVRDNGNLPLYLLKKSGRQFGDKLTGVIIANMSKLGLIETDNAEVDINEIAIYMKYHLAGFATLLTDFDSHTSESDVNKMINHVLRAATEGPITVIASMFEKNE